MQLEQNLSLSLFDFAMKDPETGLDLEPVFGGGKTGLANLGNSCYLGSVVQVLFSFGEWRRRYFFGQGMATDSTMGSGGASGGGNGGQGGRGKREERTYTSWPGFHLSSDVK